MSTPTATRRPNAAHDPSGTRCAHFRYQMTCEELDQLREQAGDRCALCDIPGEETPHGSLHIDHDAAVGDWAVRGLLCSYCNTQLDSHVHQLDEAKVAAYLADPWYLRMLAALGLSAEMPGEPAIGTMVTLPRGTVMRRTEDGWHWESGPGGVRRSTWAGIFHRFGPRGVRVGVEQERPADSDDEIRAIRVDYERERAVALQQRNEGFRAAIASGRTQADLIKLTGWSRETVRQALDPSAREAARQARKTGRLQEGKTDG